MFIYNPGGIEWVNILITKSSGKFFAGNFVWGSGLIIRTLLRPPGVGDMGKGFGIYRIYKKTYKVEGHSLYVNFIILPNKIILIV